MSDKDLITGYSSHYKVFILDGTQSHQLSHQTDFMEDAMAAERDIAAGSYKSADEVFDGLEQRYGF